MKNCLPQNQLERQGGRGEGVCVPSVTFKIVFKLHIEEEGMLLLVFYYFICAFLCRFVSFDAFSSALYRCFKAMLLVVGINPNKASLLIR